MRVLYNIGRGAALEPAVCAASNFDGVHRGHAELARRAVELAQELGGPAAAVVIWEGERAEGGLLTLLDERLALLEDLAAFDAALVISAPSDAVPLTPEALLAAIEHQVQPAAFLGLDGEPGLSALLDVAQSHDVRAVAIAPAEDAVGGRDVAGGGDDPLGRRLEHREPNPRTMNERIAELLLAGDVRGAAARLGHPYGVEGEVVSGDRRGRLLGFPTANLRLDARKVLPADGIYAVRARLPGEQRAMHPAVVSLGVRPQFGAGKPRLLEVFLLDAALDLYGLPLGVEFVEWLREERRFTDVEALKIQMARDVEMARDVLNQSAQGTTQRDVGRTG